MDLARVSTRSGITIARTVLGSSAENQVNQTQPFTLIFDIFRKKRLFQLMLMFSCNFFSAASDLLWLCSALT